MIKFHITLNQKRAKLLKGPARELLEKHSILKTTKQHHVLLVTYGREGGGGENLFAWTDVHVKSNFSKIRKKGKIN